MKIHPEELPLLYHHAVCGLRDNGKDCTCTTGPEYAHVASDRLIQDIILRKRIEALTDKQVHDLFRGFHDDYDIDDDRRALVDVFQLIMVGYMNREES